MRVSNLPLRGEGSNRLRRISDFDGDLIAAGVRVVMEVAVPCVGDFDGDGYVVWQPQRIGIVLQLHLAESYVGRYLIQSNFLVGLEKVGTQAKNLEGAFIDPQNTLGVHVDFVCAGASHDSGKGDFAGTLSECEHESVSHSQLLGSEIAKIGLRCSAAAETDGAESVARGDEITFLKADRAQPISIL